MEQLPDEELVAQYRARPGSPGADSSLNELFQRYHGRVALWCLRLTGDRESAADLAQEVFIKVFRNLDSYRGDSKFSTWLYAITRNHCFNEVKSRAARPEQAGELLLEGLADHAANPYTQLERANLSATLRELMSGALTELESRVMTLHYSEELSLEAVAQLLGLQNASGAKAYIVSARRKLARAVERWKAREQNIRP
ncbi:MAG: sigma-70 family RNA polymerase sigma factor [Acidobacteriia bacterium]|nr:sigma-70 family RNA polymerase sigma factor [Terriglobia bacterium]